MPKEISEFFLAYRDAFNALDGAAVAALYAEPSGIAQGGQYTHWPSRERVRANMEALCRMYQDRGFVAADFEIESFVFQGGNHAFADLKWHITWTEGQQPWRFNTSYNLVHTSDGWKVLLCTAYTEDKLLRTPMAA